MTYAIPPRDLAWFSGLFEGEGYFDPKRRQLTICSTDLDVLKHVQSLIGGHIYEKHVVSEISVKKQWQWQLCRWEEVSPLIKAMMPWLGERRKEAAQKILDNKPVKAQLTDRCNKGHLFSDTGFYLDQGKKRCRRCIRERQRAHRARERMKA